MARSMDDPTDFRQLSQPFDAFRDEIAIECLPFGEFHMHTRAEINYGVLDE